MTSKRLVPLSEYHRLPQETLGAEYYKRLLEVVCNNSTVAIFIMDERQQCVYMNPAAEKLTGFSLEETKGRILHDVVHHTRPNGRPYPLCECPIDQAFPQNNQEQGEEVFVHKDGSFYSVAYTASPIREGDDVIGTIIEVRDITQEKLDELARQEVETALRNSERRYRHLVESNMFGVVFGDFTGGVHYANDYFLKMLGYTRSEIEAGQVRWNDITPPEFSALDDIAVTELKQKGVATPFEKEYIRKDGTRVPILIGSTLLQKPYEQEQEIIAFFLDQTQRQQAETERIRLLEQEKAARSAAESANRIKDEFLAVLSHELRSPLNPILGWSKLLLTKTFDPKRTKFALETIERNAKLQSELIEDLLDVSRILRGKLSLNIASVDLITIIHSAIETVRLAAEAKSIQILTLLEPNSGRVRGDSSRLQQVFWNLLSNAIKFTPPGGQVKIQLEHSGDFAYITVNDNGKGISPEFLPYVFEYFRQENSTSTRQFGGLGLGLAIVHHLVELHGGTVQATSEGEGKGATFTVRLPLALAQQKTNENSPQHNQSRDLTGMKILVVDDETDSREFIGFVLQEAGATVMMVNSALEALTSFTDFQPDLLLSDIGMPDLDGYQLMQQVRALPKERGGEIPAIALSAYAGEFNERQAMLAGFQQHISKPVDPEKLVQELALIVAN